MSQYEAALLKTTEKQQMAFRKLFLKDPDVFCVDLSGNEDSKELHTKRGEIRKLARGMLDTSDKEKRMLNEDEKQAFDVCTALLNDIQVAFDAKQERSFATNAINGTTGVSSSRNLEQWQDVSTGKTIPVLTKDHKFADRCQRSNNAISANSYFAALAGHNVSPEVRAAMTEGTDIKGGFMVPEIISNEIIDLLRAKNQIINAGARSIPLPSAVTRVCRVVSDPTAQWTPENTQIAEDSSMSLGALEFHAKK